MTARPKFLFDNDFARNEAARPSAASLAQQQAALAEAEARGYRTGQSAGQAEAAADAQRKLAAALDRAGAALEGMVHGLAAVETRLEIEAVEVAVAIARKLAGALLEREPFAEIAALARENFRPLVGVPHVVVRVNDALYEEARARLGEIAQRCGFEGRLVVLAEPDIAPGDCRIEWADGGAVRDRAAVESAIAAAIERYLAARGGAGGDAGQFGSNRT
ncbi:MAG: flagellar assembly protein FliH [Variibacter sp.]|nr:flagellar assembly protein FliH [Variibacter sp.]